MASPASSTSSSSSSSSVHHASLVDPALHSPALLELVDVKVSRSVIEYVVDRVVETVDYAMGRPTPSSSKSRSSRGRTATRRPENAKFTTFVSDVITRAEVTMPTLLATLVYIDRARPHLHIGLEQWALERVFLGALIVASKYLNDSTLKNVHWALCTGVFGKRDVGRIEREYLDVLNFELKITEDDLLSHHEGLAEVSHLTLSPRSAIASLEMEMEVDSSSAVEQPMAPRERRHRRTQAPSIAVAVAPSVPELSPSSCESSPNSASSSSSSSSASFSPRTPPDAAIEHHEPKARSKHQQHPSIAQQLQQQTPSYGTAGKLFQASRQLFHIPRLSTA
ncbi:hypothetical protein D9619_005207 [Psilocybe cf. subviscida]|uniref:Cyclin N-terminal domain-containing protein n=1 Tax=Psilocybe cf. subviscida TaxID=2480587 RepID=A0A8H5BXA3_9AGAR|nr:hypothetical protein D9619_005207 [Psilocybe cf. subviscida]